MTEARGPRGRGFVLKRLLDIVAATLGLALLSPLFAALAAAIRWEDGGPAFYRQARVGLAGRPFRIVKFRSMTVAQGPGSAEITVSGDPRITRVGAFIRRHKLDELPQLWNVLIGDMSLVGPRPETPSLLSGYSAAQRGVITSLRPGITDWASLLLRDEGELLASSADPAVFYRDTLVPLKCALWQCYRDEAGLWTDARILAATLWAVAAPRARNPWLSARARVYSETAALTDIGRRRQVVA